MDQKKKQQSRKRRGGGFLDFLSGKKTIEQLNTELANAKKKVTDAEAEVAELTKQIAAAPATAPVQAPAEAPAEAPVAAPSVGGKTKKRRKNKK